MTLPTVTVELGESGPRTAIASTTWEDVSADVRAMNISRGRNRELDKMGAGRAVVILDNADRAFDTLYAASPHAAYLKPTRRIRIRAVHNAITYDLFSGFVDRIRQSYAPPTEAVAVIEATDAFKVLEALRLPVSVYALEVAADTPVHWWRLGEAVGATVASDGGSSRADGTYSGALTLGVAGFTVNDPDTAVEFTDGSSAYMRAENVSPSGSGAYSVEYIVKVVTTPAGSRAVLAIRDSTNGTTIASTVNSSGHLSGTAYAIDDGNPHHVVLKRRASDGRTFVYVDGVDRTDGTPTDATSLNADGDLHVGHPGEGAGNSMAMVIDEVAIYDSELSAARILAHYDARATAWAGDTSGARIGRVLDAVAWPSADRSIDTGNSTVKSAELAVSALAHIAAVEEAEQGLFFVTKAGVARFRSRAGGYNLTTQATFGDAGAELRYGTDLAYEESDDLVYNVVRRTRDGGVTQEARDATSITEHYERTDEVSGLLNETDAEMLDAANLRLALYKDPQTRIGSFPVEPLFDEAGLFPQILGRELGEQVVVKRRPQGVGAAIDQTLRIEGMAISMTPKVWTASWQLSPLVEGAGAGSGDFLQLDDTDGPGLGFVRLAA